MNSELYVPTYYWEQNGRKEIEWFKECLLDAKKNEHDIIFFNKKNFKSQYESKIEDYISLIERERIFFLAVDAKCNELNFKLQDNIRFCYKLCEINSFYVTFPLFDFLIDILDNNVYETIEETINQSVLRKFYLEYRTQPDDLIEQKIIVLIPFRNCINYIEDCYKSICIQKYSNFEVVLINDFSTDGSEDLIKTFKDIKTTIITNDTQFFALKSLVLCLNNLSLDPNSIIVFLDGDDVLTHEFVLKTINYHYSTYDCKITYGSFMSLHDGTIHTSTYNKIDFENIRMARWQASHLKTFKYALYQELQRHENYLDNFKDNNGSFLKAPYDMAIMFPLLELAGYEKSIHIAYPLYGYRLHPNNDHVVMKNVQQCGENILRSKKRLSKTT